MATAPQAAMEMPQEGPNPYADPNTMAVYDQMRQSVSPKEFGDQVLAGAEQVDPQAVAQFKSTLEQIQMPPEALDLLNNMVDEILANPEKYAEIRAKYKEMGAPDEILPEQFDAHFFSALNMAVDQMVGAPSGEQAFAKGGIAELKPVSKAIASYGRNGDTMLAHITPAEARMLRRKGGSGTINPKTGLPEFFNLFKEIGNAFKAVGNAVKDFASSTVGRIVTTVALGFFLGPAAASFLGATSTAAVAAVSGFVGSAGSTLLAGGNLSQALKAGAVGGLTAGATAGVTGAFGGTNAFEAGSYSGAGLTPMEALQGQVDKFTTAMTPSGIQAPSITPSGQATGMAPAPATNPLADNFTANTARESASDALASKVGLQPPVDASFGNQLGAANPDFSPMSNTGMGGPGTASFGSNPAVQFDRNMLPDTFAAAPAPTASATTAAAGNTIAPPIQAAPTIGTGPYNTPGVLDSASQAGKGILQMLPGTEGTFSEGLENFTKGTGNLLSPGPSSSEITARAKDILGADTTGKMTYADALRAANAETPGFLRSYGPATALGIGAIGAFGGFSPSKVPESSMKKTLMGGPGSAQDLLKKDPYRFYIQGLPGVNYYSGSVLPPTGMATGGEVQHFAKGGQPSMAEWLDKAGISQEAREKGSPELYAAINAYNALGSSLDPYRQEDTRDWDAVMAAENPIDALIQQNLPLYGGEGRIELTDTGGRLVSGAGNNLTSDLSRYKEFGIQLNPDELKAQLDSIETSTPTGRAKYERINMLYQQALADQEKGSSTAVTTGKTKTNTVGAVDSSATTANTANTANRSAADQAIWNYFLTPGLTDAQIVQAMNTNKWSLADIARVTGTTDRMDEYARRFAAVSGNTGTGTGTGTGTVVTTTPGGLTSIQAPWFINPQTFAQGTKGVTVPSSTLRNTTSLPTDALSRTIQGDLQGAGPTATNQTMQEWMDSRNWKPEQVAYATGAGVPEVQNRYWGAKNATILGGNAAPATPITQPYNNTSGITQLMSPTGPLGEFSTRTVAPVAPILPVTPTAPTGGITSLMPAASTPNSQNLPVIPQNTVANDQLAAQAAEAQKDYLFAMNDKKAAFMNMGGIAGLAQGGYPRRTGQIEGPGTATSDSIPAMLSDGEFVMTAKAVRGAGKGDRRAGAKRMYALMHQLEKNAARG